MDLDSVFGSMAKAKGSSSGVFFSEGVYKVALKEIEYIPRGYRGTSCIFRFTVVESNNTAACPLQATRVWIVKLDKPDQKERALADIKNLVFAACGMNPRDYKDPEQDPKAHEDAFKLFKASIDATFAAQAGLDSQALIGQEVNLECTKAITKPSPKSPNGGEFTRHNWSPVD